MTKTQKNDLYVTKIKMWGVFFGKKNFNKSYVLDNFST